MVTVFSNNYIGKKLAYVSCLLLSFLILPSKAAAQQYYEPLEDIPILTDSASTTATSVIKVGGENSLPNFANNVIQIMIGVAIASAVVMIIYAGATYMTTGSFTKKGKAKEYITNAVLGLLLALASVALLNTINPNLTKLNSIENVEVEKEFNPLEKMTSNPEEGIYICYRSDRFNDNPMDYFCSEDPNVCTSVFDDDKYAESDGCSQYLFFQGIGSEITSRTDDSCFGWEIGPDKRLSCYENREVCQSEESSVADQGATILAECQNPEGFGEGSIANFNDYIEKYIKASSTAVNPEVSARNSYVNSEDYLEYNVGMCDSVLDSSCTNVGGMSDQTWENIIALKNSYTEPRSDCGGVVNCTVTISGGTSWWLHGDRQYNPFDNGSTCHNPVGLDSENTDVDLCTGAVDFSISGSDPEFTAHMDDLIDGADSGCIQLNDGSGTSTHWVLREDTHWHVEFGDPTGKCSE